MEVFLFKKDEERVPSIYDLRTSNQSFIRMAAVLKKMGIKNHLFMLALRNPKLQGVNPYDKNITPDMAAAVVVEAKINPWYMIRECTRIPMEGADSIPFILNRANLATLWCFFNNIHIFLTMPRQRGKTMVTSAIFAYLLYILGTNLSIGLFAKDSTLQAENVARIKLIRDNYPSYFWESDRKYNTNNQESLQYIPRNNIYRTHVAASNKTRARRQGRGSSTAAQHWDEFAYYVNNSISYDAAKSASDKAMLNARESGLPAAIIITTTAGYTNVEYGKYAFDMKEAAFRFTEHLYDMEDEVTLLDVIMKGSGNTRMVYLEYSYSQLGASQQWFDEVTAGKSKEAVETDYLNHWLHGTGENVIPRHLMDKLESHVMDPLAVTVEHGLVIHWWVQPNVLEDPKFKNTPFIIGCDTSDNAGQDFTTVVIINPKDMAVIATFRCNQANLVYVAQLVVDLLKRFRRAIFIPERNRAAAFIDMVIEQLHQLNIDPFKRVFNYFTENYGSAGEKPRDLTLGAVRSQFGFKTTSAASSRQLLYGRILSTTVEHNYMRIFSKDIVEELSCLTIRNGRVDHAVHGHDDTLIAYLIACWFVMYAHNLQEYGIRPEELIERSEEGDIADSQSSGIKEVARKIEQLNGLLKSTQLSPMMRQAFEIQVRDLSAVLELQQKAMGDTNPRVPISSSKLQVEQTPTRIVNINELQSDLFSIFK